MGIVGTAAFCLWPLIAIFLYRSMPAGRATLWNFVGAQMLLPTGFIKFEIIPAFDKASIPTLCALIGCLASSTRMIRPGVTLPTFLLAMYFIVPIASAISNADPIVTSIFVIPGVGLYDGLSAAQQALIIILPFVFGRQLFRTPQDSEDILRTLIISGIVYSIPMLFEIRFSPQLHFWIYGSYSSDFIQSMRDDAYRPMVFMGHGLLASFFVMATSVAATAFWRTRTSVLGFQAAPIAGYLGILLVLCKSLGTTMYGFLSIPLVRFASPRVIVRVALVIATVAIMYPLLRVEGLVPTDLAISVAKKVSDDRSRSLEFRFMNEEILLEHASQRPWFGWGRFGRSRVYDFESGKDLTVTDGRWIITLGQYGILGFLAEFGLLILGVLRIGSILKYVKEPREKLFLATIALILSLNVFDLLPNSTLTPFTFLLAGALTGRLEAVRTNLRRSRQLTTPAPHVDTIATSN